jgi:endonuclease/exonuclease/phosphatase family metal-dependent hydrolase
MLTLATQNIWGRMPLWHLRKRAMARKLRGADVALLQEVQARGKHDSQAHQLAKHMGLPHARFASAGRTLWWREGVAIISRWPVVHLAWEHLPQRRNNLVDRAAPRLVLRAVIDAPVGRVEVYALHLSLSQKSRTAAAERIAAFVRRERQAFPADFTVLGGDLNASPEEPSVTRLKEACALRDFQEGGRGTFPAWLPTRRRLDYLLVSPNLKLMGTKRPASVASDHCGLMLKVSL